MGGSDHCCFFNGVATKDVIVASNNDVNFVETQTVHFVWLNRSLFRFEIINKVDLDFSQRQILSFVCPLKYHLIFAFIPSILKRVQRWWVSWIRSINSLLRQKGWCIKFYSVFTRQSTIRAQLFASRIIWSSITTNKATSRWTDMADYFLVFPQAAEPSFKSSDSERKECLTAMRDLNIL